jgi:hypothetical protein
MLKTTTEINLDTIFANHREINKHAETKSYYALVLLGLLSVPLFSLFIDLLDHQLFKDWTNQLLFSGILLFFLFSLFALLFSFIPRIATGKKEKQNIDIEALADKYEHDYYHYRFWSHLRGITSDHVEDFFAKKEIVMIGNSLLIPQISKVAWIAKIKFIAFNVSIVFQLILIILMSILTMLLIF